MPWPKENTKVECLSDGGLWHRDLVDFAGERDQNWCAVTVVLPVVVLNTKESDVQDDVRLVICPGLLETECDPGR